MLPRIVPVEDEDISKELERVLQEAEDPRRDRRASAENIQKTGNGVKLTADARKTASRKSCEAEKLLVAVGRKPNTEKIGLENTKVELDRGFIKVDPVPADRRARRLRHRRRGRRHAATGARGHARRHDRGGAHGRQARDADQPEPHSGRHLHRAGHRQRGPDRGAGARRRATR